MTPAPLQLGQAPSELALNSAGFTPLAFANALRIGSSSPSVRRRVAPSRAADRALVDRHHTRAGGDRPVHERALAGAGDAGDDDKHPERDVDVDVAQVVRRRAADLQPAAGRPHRLLEGGPVVEMAPGDGAAGPQPLDGALADDGAAPRAGTGTEVAAGVG